MRKFIIIMMAMVFMATQAWAVVIENVAGDLSNRLTDAEATDLTITGTLDARDFKFIAQHLDQLTAIDLSGAAILAYENDEPVFGEQMAYGANEIPQTSFFGKPLTQVVLPQRLSTIGYAAFAGCGGITHITFPATLDSISGYAFCATGFSELTLPATVTKIGEGAFARCEKLTEVSIESGAIGANAFYADALLSSVTLGKGVTAIGNNAFAGCKHLTTLKWSSATQLMRIGSEAFIATQITDADLSKFQSLGYLGAWAYAGTPVERVSLPAALKEVGDGAFYYAHNVTNLVLPTKVTKVGAYLAAGTQVSNSDIWGNDITRIGDYALYNLAGIDKIGIPSQVTYIGNMAMAGMTGLERITAKPTQVPMLGEKVWAGVAQAKVELTAASAAYTKAPQWKEFMVKRRYILGDANTDDMVNVTDITTIINHILGNNPAKFNFEAADCATDSVINVSDITNVINIILSGNTTEVVTDWKVNTDDEVTVDDINIAPGETRTVNVTLHNGINYTALQFDLHLPEGVEIVSIDRAARSANHALYSGKLPDGSLRVVSFNMQNANFEGNDGAIFSITLKASGALSTDATIYVTNTILATAADQTYFAPATSARLTSASAVTDVSKQEAKVYSQSGRVVIESEKATTAQLIAINGTSMTLAVEAGHNEYEAPSCGVYIVRIEGKSYKLLIK